MKTKLPTNLKRAQKGRTLILGNGRKKKAEETIEQTFFFLKEKKVGEGGKGSLSDENGAHGRNWKGKSWGWHTKP